MTVEGSKLVYEIPDENSLAEYLSSTLIVSSPQTRRDSLAQRHPSANRRCTTFLPHRRSLLRSSHVPIDGIGTMRFWHRYLSALASPATDPQFGDDGLPAVGLASSAGTAPPTLRCQFRELKFSREITKSLIDACKKRGISVTSALHAAYIITLTRHAHPKTSQSRHTTMNEYDLRPYFPDPYNTDRSAVGVYFVPLPFRADLPASFSDLADGLKRSYRMGFSEDRELLKVVGSFTRAMAQFLQTEFQANLIGTSALVSSLGVVENHVQRSFGGAVSVLDFSFTVEVVIGMSALHFYTFRDWLRCVHSVDEMFEPSQIGHYLEEMERLLREELLDGGSTAANQD